MKLEHHHVNTRTITAALLIGAIPLLAPSALAGGIVASIEKAPVVADGDVSGKPTDYVITLEGSLDSDVPGRSLAAGNVIKVIFPHEFDLSGLNPAYPLLDAPTPLPPVLPLSDNDCVPGYLTCTTAVILRGWPQDPYFPPALFHTLSIDPVDNALIFTALQDLSATSATNPGIKQLHLILNGVTNPAPGQYLIRVEAQTGPGGAWETGSGLMQVLPHARPSINVTAVFVKATSGQLGVPACGPGTNPPNADNPIHQKTTVGAVAPFPWTFLLWGRGNQPLTDVSLRWVDADHAQLRRANRTIGHVYIDAPRGATGYGIEFNPLACGTLLAGAPVIAGTPGIGPQPVGRMDLVFRAGDLPGEYWTTLTLNQGNSVRMVVTAN
jgi:hypothetical protein